MYITLKCEECGKEIGANITGNSYDIEIEVSVCECQLKAIEELSSEIEELQEENASLLDDINALEESK